MLGGQSREVYGASWWRVGRLYREIVLVGSEGKLQEGRTRRTSREDKPAKKLQYGDVINFFCRNNGHTKNESSPAFNHNTEMHCS